jgi:hypothetical protein
LPTDAGFVFLLAVGVLGIVEAATPGVVVRCQPVAGSLVENNLEIGERQE